MITLVLFLLFVAFLVGIGVWSMRHTGTVHDFVLAGRGLGPWVAALSYGTSYFSGVLFIGFAGKLGWVYGLDAVWIGAGNALFGSLLAWLVLGKRTRRMTHNLNAITMPEFFCERYGSVFMKVFAALIIFIFLLPYSASVFKGLGHLFEVQFGLHYIHSLFIMTAIAGVYLILGGYVAASRTDFLLGLIMLAGTLAMVGFLVMKGGGTEIFARVSEGFAATSAAAAERGRPFPGKGLLAALVFMTSFGTWGLPQMTQKFYAIRHESMIWRGAIVTTVFAVVVGIGAYFTGALSHVFVDMASPAAQAAILRDGAFEFDRIMPYLLASTLPDALMALILLLILAASLSTLASLVLVSSSAVAIDIYKVHVRHDNSTGKPVRLMRILTGVFLLASFGLAVEAERNCAFILELMSLSWGVVAGSFMAPFLYGLFWRGATRAGAIAGMLTGLGVMLAGYFHPALGPGLLPVTASAAMILPFAVVPLVSLATQKPDAARLEQAFAPLAS